VQRPKIILGALAAPLHN